MGILLGPIVTSEQFLQSGANRPSPDAFMKVPSSWNGKVIDGQPLPAHGLATYRMVLRNVPFDGVFALKKTNIRFSSALYANGIKLFEDGKPSEKAAGYQAGNTPKTDQRAVVYYHYVGNHLAFSIV